MPHLVLECSDNLGKEPDLKALQQVLVDNDVCPMDAIKSRSVSYSNFIAGGADKFAHLTLALLPGRSDEKKTRTSASLQKCLQEQFNSVGPVAVTVEVRELHAASYQK